MLNSSSHKLILLTIKILLVITPLYSFAEVMAFINGSLTSQSEALTPVYIKIIKDLGFIFIMLFSSISILQRKRISKVFIYCIPIGFLTIVSFLVSYSQSPILAVAGLRWILPIFLLFFLVNEIEDKTMEDINSILSFLLVISFSLQIYQLFYASGWFGVNQFGLAARTPGIFLIPNTCAFFDCLCVFFNFFFNKKPNFWLLLIACISIFLTASGTGIIVLFFLLLIMFATKIFTKSRVKLVIALVTPLISFILFIFFSVILEITTGRGSDYAEISGGIRWEIFVDALNRASLLSSEFGVGTNSGILLIANQGDFNSSMIVDSMYTAIVVNTGLLGTFIFLIFILGWITFVFRYKQVDAICFTLIYLVFSSTINMTESFPINLLYAVVTAYYASSQTKIKQVYG